MDFGMFPMPPRHLLVDAEYVLVSFGRGFLHRIVHRLVVIFQVYLCVCYRELRNNVSTKKFTKGGKAMTLVRNEYNDE